MLNSMFVALNYFYDLLRQDLSFAPGFAPTLNERLDDADGDAYHL